MTKDELKQLLQRYKRGTIGEQDIVGMLTSLGSEHLGFATVDHHRQLRQGFPEVIFCQGKTPKHVAEIAVRIVKRSQPLLATRATKAHFTAVKKKIRTARYTEAARTITANEPKQSKGKHGTILVITAGTSDIPVAEEAVITARMSGNRVETL